MAFRKKAIYILPHNPDILIIPECECIENLIFTEDVKKADDIYIGLVKTSIKELVFFHIMDIRYPPLSHIILNFVT